MAEVLSMISLISFIVSGVCFALVLFFWFKFKIPTVIGDLSGRTARKSIAKLRETNEKTGSKSYRASSINASRGKLTGAVGNSEKLAKEQKMTQAADLRPETGLLADNMADAEVAQETDLLSSTESTGLLVDTDATMPLDNQIQKKSKRSGGKRLVMLDEVILVHTDEVVQ